MHNIVLIGMPASGKSTAGVLIAKRAGYGFIDSDLLIQKSQGKLLCDILADKGAEGFIGVEERVNCIIEAENCVIATGGSVIYGDKAMAHLKSIGTVVYLRIALEELEKRLAGQDIFARGVVMRKKSETLAQLYDERVPLYEKYADITIDCSGLTIEQTVCAVISSLKADGRL